MCGISGIVNWSTDISNQNEIIKKMNDSIIHRGPDAEGFYLSENVLIGHRRLIIIDAEGGKQPMIYKNDIDENKGSSVILAYNGELYNFLEIKKELEQMGHVFKTRSDTEVVLLSYIEWGEQCLSKFNGIFAIAIYDERNSSLFLARDRIGVKPLFYSILDDGNTILIGSEIKVFLSHPSFKPYVDKEGLNEIFTLGLVKTPDHSIFRDIKYVPSGNHITFTKNKIEKHFSSGCSTINGDGFSINKVEYWNLKSFKHTDNIEQTTNKVYQLLKQSVEKQLVSDKPVGFLLSGGLDSSSIVAIASKVLQPSSASDFNTFSLSYENEELNFKKSRFHRDIDEPFARLVAKDCSTTHNTITMNLEKDLQGDHNIFKSIRESSLYPSHGTFDVSFFEFFKQIKSKSDCKVILSGEVSDEIFSGYAWFEDEKVISSECIPSLVGVEMHNQYNLYLKDDVLEKLDYKNFKQRKYNELLNQVPHLDGEDPIQRKQRIISYYFIKHFAHFLLERKDRCSMKNSIEVRVPFGDHELIEYCFNIPYNLKSIDNIEKGILRRSIGDLLPIEVLNRKKSSYPIISDIAYFYHLCDQIESVLNNQTSPILQFIKPEPIQEIAKNKSNYNDPYPQRCLFEHILLTNEWMKEYKIIFV